MANIKMELNRAAVYTKGGVTLRDVAVDKAAIERAIGGIHRPMVVIEQSPAAGTLVARGTTVDIVVTDTTRLPMGVISQLPQAWNDKLIGPVADAARADPKVLDIIEKNDTSASLSGSDKETLIAFAKRAGVEIDSSTASLDGAMAAARSAHLLASG